MSISNREVAFLMFFLPIFSLKLLDTTAESNLLVVTSVVCTFFYLLYIFRGCYSKSLVKLFFILFSYSFLLIFTCGKQGIFFSVLMLFAMNGIDMNKIIYKICTSVGFVFFILACYLNIEGDVTTRYFGGEWVEMTKRSNILYVSFIAVVSLYLLKNRYTIRAKHIIGLMFLGYVMYLYVGSRTGFLMVVLLVSLIALFKFTKIANNKIFRWCCFMTPVFGMLFSLFSAVCYGKYEFLNILDMIFQGRLYQNWQYLNRYGISILGQHIYEGSDKGEFWNLDCAYMDMLICEGLLFSVVWIIVSIAVIKFFYKRNRMIEVALLIMYSIYGISETFLINCFFNMSLFLYGEWLYNILIRKKEISVQN